MNSEFVATWREAVEGGAAGPVIIQPLVYWVREFDPFDTFYDPDRVWVDGWGNFWCALGTEQ